MSLSPLFMSPLPSFMSPSSWICHCCYHLSVPLVAHQSNVLCGTQLANISSQKGEKILTALPNKQTKIPRRTSHEASEPWWLRHVQPVQSPAHVRNTSSYRSQASIQREGAACPSPTHPMWQALETPTDCLALLPFPVVSAMKGGILTETGKSLATPMPMKVVDILVDLPRVSHSLRFAKIFDFDKADEENNHQNAGVAMSTPTKSPS